MPIINIISVLVFFLILPPGYSKNLDTIAILPFSGQGIDDNELNIIETALRDDINKSNDFQAFEPTRMMQLLENNGITEVRACNEITCAIFMGNILSTNFITQCRIGKIEKSYTINLRIIDVKNKEVVKDIAEYFNGSMSNLLKKIVPKIARTIVKTKLSDRKFAINGMKEDNAKRDTSNPQLQSPQKAIYTDDDSRGVPNPVENSGEVKTPGTGEALRTVNVPRIVATQRKIDTPRKIDPPRRVEAPEEVEIVETEVIPEIISIPTDGISNSMEKETPQVAINKKIGSGIRNQKNRIKLRSTPRGNLKPEEIKKMILINDFYCNNSDISIRWSNPDSKYTTNHLAVLSGDKILIDSTTQLMWQSEGSLERLRYNQINQYVIDINSSYFGGFNDWRLPTLEEAMSIVTSKQNNGLYISEKFSSIQNVIWTADKVSVDYSMIVRFDVGQCNYGSTQLSPLYIRLVRSF